MKLNKKQQKLLLEGLNNPPKYVVSGHIDNLNMSIKKLLAMGLLIVLEREIQLTALGYRVAKDIEHDRTIIDVCKGN